MSIRVDSSPLIEGSVQVGNDGLGVFAEQVPAFGANGAGFAFSSLQFPEDNGKEIIGRIARWPTNGTLVANEDTSFSYAGQNDSFDWQLYVDGQAVGSPVTVTLQTGLDQVDKSVTSSYLIRNLVSKTVSSSYEVLSDTSITKSITSNYVIRNFADKSVGAEYSIRNYVDSLASSSYTIRNLLDKSITSEYTVRNYASNEVSSQYLIRNYVDKLITSSYEIINTERDVVDKAVTSSYQVVSYVFKSVTSSYSVGGEPVNRKRYTVQREEKRYLIQIT